MNFAREAGEAFSQGRFAEAAALYEAAIEAMPLLASSFLPSLRLAQARCHKAAQAPGRPMVEALYDLVDAKAGAQGRLPPAQGQALVSVVMTSHNAAHCIEDAITSLLRQSWSNLEIVVVDDHSTDLTWAIVSRLKSIHQKIQAHRLNTPMGAEGARRHGIQQARGEWVFFQNSGDLSHPARIAICMQALQRPRVLAVHACFSRVKFPQGDICPINNALYSPSPATLGLKREALNTMVQVGPQQDTSAEALLDQVVRVAASRNEAVEHIALPLYFSAVGAEAGPAEAPQHPPTAHKPIEHSPPTEPGRPASAQAKAPVVLGISSVPGRERALQQTLQSLVHQVDEVHLYLDGHGEAPAFVAALTPRPTVYLGQAGASLRDVGKFNALNTKHAAAYIFAADDDIVYPPDYVATLVESIERYQRKAVMGLHGILLPKHPSGYYSAFRKVFHYGRELEAARAVHVLGTGALAFHSSVFAQHPLVLTHPGMADIDFAIACKQAQVPLVCIARHGQWLRDIAMANSPSLFDEFKHNDGLQTRLLREQSPWGDTAIREALRAQLAQGPNAPLSALLAQHPLQALSLR